MAHKQLADFPVVVEADVAWREMDSFGHVNNVVFFHYFENSRIDYLRRVGWFALLDTIGVGPIVQSTQGRFRRPLKYPDRIQIGARIITMETDRVTFEHRLVSESWDDVAAEGQAVVVCYDYRVNKKTPLPFELRERIDQLEQAERSKPGLGSGQEPNPG
jgi:acyl-CoA thioester hydrolase